jgi:hypothetical protein
MGAGGQTAGVAVWSRKRNAGAVSLLLCGLDEPRERAEALAILAAHQRPVPNDVGAKLDRERRRPLLFNVFYNLVFWTDPVVATVLPRLRSVGTGTLEESGQAPAPRPLPAVAVRRTFSVPA